MDNYRWIHYPENIDPALQDRYEQVANLLEKNATEPIALVWAAENEDWTDERGCNPPRNCLLITKHIQDGDEFTFGENLMSVILHG